MNDVNEGEIFVLLTPKKEYSFQIELKFDFLILKFLEFSLEVAWKLAILRKYTHIHTHNTEVLYNRNNEHTNY